jgi:hypothetical protein
MFYGTIQGGRGEATRLGHANTGLHVSAQSYEGSIIVDLYVANAGLQCARIAVATGSNKSGGFTLYDGPIKKLFDDKLVIPRYSGR